MTSDQFCLKWNNYQSNIVVALGNLKLDEDFVDVTLACEGRTIKAHRVVLSACSSYFKHIFKVSFPNWWMSLSLLCSSWKSMEDVNWRSRWHSQPSAICAQCSDW